jgi:hypothetical protein
MTDDRAKVEAKARATAWLMQEYQTAPPEEVAHLTDLIVSVQEETPLEMACAVLEDRPLKGEYLHLVTCSGSRRHSPLISGHSCSCPVGLKARGRDAEVKRVVEEAWATIPALQSPPGLLSTRDEILRRLGLEADGD